MNFLSFYKSFVRIFFNVLMEKVSCSMIPHKCKTRIEFVGRFNMFAWWKNITTGSTEFDDGNGPSITIQSTNSIENVCVFVCIEKSTDQKTLCTMSTKCLICYEREREGVRETDRRKWETDSKHKLIVPSELYLNNIRSAYSTFFSFQLKHNKLVWFL